MYTMSQALAAGSNWTDPVLGMEFVWIAPLGMWVGKHVVTNEEYRRYVPGHDSGDFEGHSLNEARQPVVRVNHDEAMAFCAWLTEELRATGAISEHFLRIPGHEEWTTFARCGDDRMYPWGNEWPPEFGIYADESSRRAFPDWEVIEGYDCGHPVAAPVEASGENDWGLCGLGGNVYEWTFQAGGTSCELRGASWSTFQREYLMVSNRYQREPKSRLFNFGFRMVLLV
jgi:formylglycine-generating enzyme